MFDYQAWFHVCEKCMCVHLNNRMHLKVYNLLTIKRFFFLCKQLARRKSTERNWRREPRDCLIIILLFNETTNFRLYFLLFSVYVIRKFVAKPWKKSHTCESHEHFICWSLSLWELCTLYDKNLILSTDLRQTAVIVSTILKANG